jgi:GrpB-like predicted nucleotidyltransferase (UPF0157 family)
MKKTIKIFPYNPQSRRLFAKENIKIKSALKNLGGFRVDHVGSTAVPGLGGKGIIDVMVSIDDWKKQNEFIEALRKIGFKHVHPEHKERIFLSRVPKTKYGETHLHLVKAHGSQYKELLGFRNYLRKNKIAAKEYNDIKFKLIKEVKGNRLAFGKKKGLYLKKALKRI